MTGENARTVEQMGFMAAACVFALGFTWFLNDRAPVIYNAKTAIRLSAGKDAPKPDLEREKRLLVSDELLLQVLKDANLIPQEGGVKFRSFDLGPGITSQASRESAQKIDIVRENLSLQSRDEESAILLHYRSKNEAQAKEILQAIVNKFIDWRRSGIENGFDADMVAADKNLAVKREEFLNSQRAFLEFVERSAAARKKSDPERQKLEAEIAQLKLRYGPLHPAMQAAIKKLAALDETQAKVVTTDEDQIRIASLRDKMEKDFQNLDAAIRAAVALQQKKAEAAPFEIMPLGDVHIKSSAHYFKYEMAWAAFLSLVFAWLYIRIRPLLYPSFDSARDVERVLKVPVLGFIPFLTQDGKAELKMPKGAMAEAVKNLRAEIKLRTRAIPTKLLTVTATTEDEGRTALTVALARLAAMRGSEKVLMIDADLRSPTFQTFLPPAKTPRNLVDYLSGQVRIEDIIIRSDPSGAHIIYGTAVPNTALDLLSSDKMKTLLHSLREVYDLVIVQASLAPKGPDARILGALSDQTIYVVGTKHSLKSEVVEALRPFRLNGAINLSLVLHD